MYNKNLVYLPWRKKENLLKDSYKQSSAACAQIGLVSRDIKFSNKSLCVSNRSVLKFYKKKSQFEVL